MKMNEKPRTSKDKDFEDSSHDTSLKSLQLSIVPYKAYYFLYYGAVGSSAPYLALYFKQLGLRAAEAAVLMGIRHLTEFIGAPLWGMIGDKYKMRKTILFFSLVSFSAGTLLILTVQPKNQQCIETGANITVIHRLKFLPEGGIALGQDGGTADIQTAPQASAYTNISNKSHATIFTRKVDKSELWNIFLTLLSIIFACQIVGCVVFTMPDALMVGFLQENANIYGTIRMWGEVGVATGSFLVGAVISLYESEVCGEIIKNYHISFYFFAGFVALSLVTLIFMEVKYSEDEMSPSSSVWPLVKEILFCHNVIVVASAFYLGTLDGLHENFGLWYLDDLGAQPYMLGIAAGFRYAAAFLGYLFSGMIINKIGLVATLAVCLASYVAVYMGYSFVLNPWVGVVLFSSQGTTYGLAWSACVVFGARVSLKVGFYAVLQGIIGGFHWGLGVGSGIVVSGLVINEVGVPKTYFIFSLMSLVVLALLLFTYWVTSLKKDTDETSYKLIAAKEQDSE